MGLSRAQKAWALVTAFFVSSFVRFSLAQDTSHTDELFAWIHSNGGEIKAKSKINNDGVRGLFANQSIREGTVIAQIPAACIMHLGNQSQAVSTHIIQALREYKLGNNSHYWPFINSWPKPGEVVAGCCMDEKYDAMWKAPYWEAHHQGWRERLVSLWHDSSQHLGATVKEVLGKDVEVTLEDVKYAAAATLTRFLSLPGSRGAMIMAPIFDLANHDRHCANTLEDFTADFLYLIAGRDYEPGDEICYSYGDLRDDVAVSGYGFLPALEDPPRLAYVDHWQFEGLRDWHGIDTEEDFDGTPEELAAEMRRLEGIRADILSMPDLVPKPEGDDYVWNMMKQLEARRIVAIDYELSRIRELLVNPDQHEEL